MKHLKSSGFTLIEILVVIAVAILLSVLVSKTFDSLNKTLFKLEDTIYVRDTVNLVLEHYRSLPFDRIFFAEDSEITHLYTDPRDKRNLRLFITIQPYKNNDMKKIKLIATWGGKENPYSMEFQMLRYRYGL